MAGADFLAALVVNCFLGAFPPVDFLAVCLVRAILVFSEKLEIGREQKDLEVETVRWVYVALCKGFYNGLDGGKF